MRRPGSAWGGAVCAFKRRARTQASLIRWCFSKDWKKDLQSIGLTDDRMQGIRKTGISDSLSNKEDGAAINSEECGTGLNGDN